MKIKVALLMLLVFASAITSTAIAFSISTPSLRPAFRSVVSIKDSLIEPLGEPIDGKDFPH